MPPSDAQPCLLGSPGASELLKVSLRTSHRDPERPSFSRCTRDRSNKAAAGGIVLDRSLLRPRLPPELLLNRPDHELHDRDVIRHAVQLEPAVKLLRDAGRQLRQDFFGLRHQAAFVFQPGCRSQTARELREESDGCTSRRRSVTEAGAACRNHRLTKPEKKSHTSEPSGTNRPPPRGSRRDSRGSSSNVKRSSSRPSPKRQVTSSGLSTPITIARLPVRRSTTISPHCGMDTSIGSADLRHRVPWRPTEGRASAWDGAESLGLALPWVRVAGGADCLGA